MMSFLQKVSKRLGTDVPKKYLSSKVYADRFPALWYQVYEKTVIYREPPVSFGLRQVDLESKLFSEFPALGVLELENGRLFGPHGWVVGQEDYLLPEHSWYGQHVSEMRVPRRWPKTNYLKGSCLSLASDWASRNYGHFLLDGLSRFHLFEKAKFSLTDVDYIYCPRPKTPNAKRLLEKIGIPIAKCIWVDQNPSIQADVVLAPSFPGIRRNYPDWVVDFFRRAVAQPPTAINRRLYISRGNGSRKIVNEQALLSILHEYGFEIYDPSQHTEQPRDFFEVAVVVGAHGAGLTDLVFCQPGANVLEMIPSDHVFPYYCSISQAAKLRYGYLIGGSLKERNSSVFDPSPYDFKIDE